MTKLGWWFVLCLAGVLYFALVPVPPNGRLHELPRPIAQWLNAHDDFANFAVFALLGWLVLSFPSKDGAAGASGKVADFFGRTGVRVGWLLALVGGLELAQTIIPGRCSDPRDLLTGVLGVLAARLLRRAWA